MMLPVSMDGVPDNTIVRPKDFNINLKKALAKKLSACDRVAKFELKHGNYCMQLSTAGFEAFSKVIFSHVHTTRSKSRHVEYIQDIDGHNKVLTDTMKIHSWMALAKPLSKSRKGQCSITVNLYRTQSSVMVNGRDAGAIVNELQKLFDAIASSEEVKSSNAKLKSTLKKTMLQKQKHKSAKLPTMTNCNNDLLIEDDKMIPSRNNVPMIEDYQEVEEHDISTNETCPTCDQDVGGNGADCDTCDRIYHYKCEGLGKQEIDNIEKYNATYTCNSCRVLVPETDIDKNQTTTQAMVSASSKHTNGPNDGKKLMEATPTSVTQNTTDRQQLTKDRTSNNSNIHSAAEKPLSEYSTALYVDLTTTKRQL